IEEAFSQKLVERIKQLKVGNGKDEGVTIGPLIDEDAIQKVQRHVDDAKAKGAEIAVGGSRKEGLFYEPTVLRSVKDDMV
ncbi:aldehyde dehydrogenase family protein, partial [Escherichia coli]|uniref:aldehyde dehydrogenase family protein n=1 Tax=Escherichia coli TaxID=562 RepID=UPI001CC9FD30